MLYLAALLQLSAAVIALYLIPLSGRRVSWILLSLGLAVQAGRRIYAVTHQATMTEAASALAVSVLLLAGVYGIRLVFTSLKSTKRELAQERSRWADFVDHAGAAIAVLDASGHVEALNDRTCTLLAVPREDVLGRDWFDAFVSTEARERVFGRFTRMMDASDTGDEYVEFSVVDAHGDSHRVVWHWRVLRDDEGVPTGVRCAGIDVSEERRLERELEFHSQLLEHTSDAVLVYRRDGTILYANRAAHAYRGQGHADLIGANVRTLIPAPDIETFSSHIQTAREGASAIFETDSIGEDMESRPMESHIGAITLDDEQVLVDVARDITERRVSEAAIRRFAYTDALTGLANWGLLCDRAANAFARARRQGGREAVLLVDVADLQDISDAYGHEGGDQVLRHVAARLVTQFRGEDTVSRVAGGQFAVLAQVQEIGEAHDLEVRATNALAEKVFVRDKRVPMRVVVGCALFPDDGEALEGLVACARERARTGVSNGNGHDAVGDSV